MGMGVGYWLLVFGNRFLLPVGLAADGLCYIVKPNFR